MNREMYEAHDAHEATHWWFVARAEIITSLLRRALPDNAPPPRILDLGCGTGGMLLHLREFGPSAGVDASPDAVAIAREKTGADVRLGALPDRIPFDAESFDVVTLLDVVEHIDDDAASFATAFRLLRPGGVLVCTVPAHQYLWSAHDVINEHKRRYARDELRKRVTGAGFKVDRISYFNMFFYPPVALLRLLRRRRNDPRPQLGIVPAPINTLFTRLFAFERHLLRLGGLPMGVSLAVVAHRPPGSVAERGAASETPR